MNEWLSRSCLTAMMNPQVLLVPLDVAAGDNQLESFFLAEAASLVAVECVRRE